ncbi:MAG: hypothetical protein ACOYXA_14985 [Bacteroidota bacterium]
MKIVISVACLLGWLSAAAQLDSVTLQFQKHRSQAYQEKIYAHIDQTFYLTGEVLWFKLYCVDGTLHHYRNLSKVAYVEVLDNAHQAVLQTKVSLEEGQGRGSIFIPATLSNGNYTFRAYTAWMKNFDPAFYYHQTISIVNPFLATEASTKGTTANLKPDAQFFPEGGNLVEGLESKVAFRVTNSEGKGVDFKGILLDITGDTILTFQPQHFGIGTFNFTPVASNQYKVVVIAGGTHVYTLPTVQPKGMTLALAEEQDKLVIKISSAPGAEGATHLFVHARQQKISLQSKRLVDGVSIFEVKKSILPDGINHLTVFNDQGIPMCERLYFSAPKNTNPMEINSLQQQFDTRRKVSLQLSGNANTSFSVAVIKKDSLASLHASTITSYLLLSSDLHGEIESPDYYLQPGRQKEIDNLMLTHGWRRFTWQELKQPFNPKFLPELRGPLVTTRVVKADGTPAAGVPAYLASPSKLIELYTALTDKNGIAHFEVKDFRGPRKIVAQVNRVRDSTLLVNVVSPFSNQLAKRNIPELQLRPAREPDLTARSVAMQVQNIYYPPQYAKPTPPADSLAFYGHADEVYLLDDYTRFPVMEEVMREYVPGVWVRKRKDGFHFMVHDDLNKTVFDDTPLMLVDGVPVFKEDEIIAFDPLKVKKLEVVNRKYYLGDLSFPGIVSYSTFTGDLNGFPLHPKALATEYDGLQWQREFYTPRYLTEQDRLNRLPDQRTLLFWNPDMRINADGTGKLEFFTSDVPGEYEVQVQGLDNQGRMGTATFPFSVRNFDN